MRTRARPTGACFALCLCLCLCLCVATASAEPDSGGPAGGTSAADLEAIGAKLANPLGNIWALQFSLNGPQFFDGNVNKGNPEVGATLVFQPVLHIPLFGEGEDQWSLITRPVIPFIFSAPIPEALDEFDRKGGIGDIQLPFLFSPPDRIAGHLIVGAGPVFQFPSATNHDLGKEQLGFGPAAVLGYKTKAFVGGIFPNYFWKIGSADQGPSTPDLSQGSLLYFLTVNLPEAWQIGTTPTITYDRKAPTENKWNVPVGPFVGRTLKIGRVPFNARFQAEYSVVSQKDFGQRFQFRFVLTPVIPSLIAQPIFGK